MKNRFGFLCGYLSISISIITIALFFFKVAPSSVVDISTFLGITAAFIGVSVTLLVGYQIFNVLDFRNKLSQVEELRRFLNNNAKKLVQLIFNNRRDLTLFLLAFIIRIAYKLLMLFCL